MSNTKRSWKLQEFVAHSANVTCLAIGPASGRVMVTGGEDKKVNMWAIGKPNVILSLSGHTTPVECVQFNSREELVCAGSQSGTLKVWDLEEAKIVRTLTGHKANIKSLDFHPYGEFVASGSLDTTVRLWDIRRKGCIVSYKGHANAINHLRFSPDGRWVISAGEDGLVKLWDLNAGKLLADFILHTGPVNCVEFHPREFLVATGSSDRTVKFWDLETFGLVCSTDVEASAVRTICFHPEGLCLFSGGHDSLRAYSWEPSCCYDAQTLGWGKVSDMAFSSNQLIGASYQATNVSVWVASMNGLEDLIEKAKDQVYVGRVEINQSVQPSEQPTYRKQSAQRKSFTTRPKTSSSKPKRSAQKDDESVDNFNKAVEQKLNDPTVNYENVFQPKSALSRSPSSQRKNPEPFAVPSEERQGPAQQKSESQPNSVPPSRAKVENIPPAHVNPVPVPTSQKPSQPVQYHPPSANQQPFQPPQTSAANQQQFQPPQTSAVNQQSFEPPVSEPPYQQPQHNAASNNHQSFPVQYQQQPRISQPPRSQQTLATSQPPRSQQTPATSQPPRSQQTPATRQQSALPVEDRMKGLNINQFSKARENAQTPNDEESTLGILERSHGSLCQIMRARLQNLSLVSRLWTDGDIKAAVETASSMSDLSVFVDIMNVLILKPTLWSLDLCGSILPQLKSLFSSNYESYVETASSSLKLILKNFLQLIKSTLSTPPGVLGVDLSREERYKKCEKCYNHLKEIRGVISERTQTSGRIGTICRELSLALSIFD